MALACALVWALLAAAPAGAREGRQSLATYVQRLWTVRDGLPQASVHAIAQTPDGHLWVGTESGLARFDGTSFLTVDTTLLPATDPAVPAAGGGDAAGGRDRPDERAAATAPAQRASGHVDALAVAPDGTLWIGSRGAPGLIRRDRTGFSAYGLEVRGMRSPEVRCALRDSRGRLWFGGASGLSVWDGKGFTAHETIEGAPFDAVYAAVEAPGDVRWFGTRRGLVRHDARGFARVRVGSPVDEATILALAVDRGGALLIGTEEAGLFRLAGGRLTGPGPSRAAREDAVRALLVDRDGSVWIGSERGVGRLTEDGRIERLGAPSSAGQIAISHVATLAQDREGGIWAGTKDGLVRLAPTPFSPLALPPGAPSTIVTSIVEGRDGSLWIGTATGGLVRHRAGSFTFLGEEQGLCVDQVRAVWEDRSGALWVGGDKGPRGSLCRVEGGQITIFGAAHGLPQGALVRALYEDRDGRLYVGTDSGLFERRDDAFVKLSLPAGKDGLGTVRSIGEDQEGTLWVGAMRLWRREATGWRQFDTSHGLSRNSVRAIVPDREGNLWLGTFSGLTRWRAGRFFPYTAEEGLVNAAVRQVLDDGRGHLWLCTALGILQVSKRVLDEHDRGLRSRVTFLRYGSAEGVGADQCEGGWSQLAGWRGRDGRLWFPSHRGVASVDPARLPAPPPTPNVLVDRVNVDGREVSPSGEIAAPPGRGELHVVYTAPTFVAPEAVRFRYRLEPYDQGWVEVGARRAAFYTNLPPGKYAFTVQAARGDGAWSEPGAAVHLRLEPHFHQTPTAVGLLAAALVGLGAGLGAMARRVRLHRVEAAHAAVLGERSRMSRDLHDTLAQSFNAISLHLEAAARLLDEGVPPGRPLVDKARGYIEEAGALARSSADETRRLVWQLRPSQLHVGGLPVALAAAARANLSSIPVDVTVHGAQRPLGEEQEAALLRIGQEAIGNAIRHAGASRIEVSLHYLPSGARLVVRDDGRGFDPGRVAGVEAGHFGLAGMRDRALALGGRLEVRAEPGRGTAVVVDLPGEARS